MNEFSSIIANLRREYVSEPLNESSVSHNPIVQFRFWFDEAVRAEQPDPEAMTLSTATREGIVSARIVLLKGFDAGGFVFFTNYQSRKGRELIDNPSAALTFYWHSLNRQVRIEGRVERVSQAESEEYFATRPRGSRIGAWTSPQSEEIPDRESL
ncbi:MAG: pyridoxamine 5'-phosphate oxidase, partial [Blastocatellia bacterium]